MKKLKIAQIGTSRNSHGTDIFKTICKLDTVFDVAGYCFPEGEREKYPELMQHFDGKAPEMTLEEILADDTIVAVTVETEEKYLFKYALMAAKAGKHIHMEKPGGRELSEYEEIISVMKMTGKTFSTGYMYRYNPYVKELVEKVKNGEIGEVVGIEAQMNCTHPYPLRQWLSEYPGGMMFFLGCHLVDLVMKIMGKPLKVTPFNKCSGKDGAEGLDIGMAVFEYENAVAWLKTSAVDIGGFVRRQLVVTGTKGAVKIEPLEKHMGGYDLTTTKREYEDGHDWDYTGEITESEIYNRYDEMMTEFGEKALGINESKCDLDYELELYRTVLLACGVKF